MTFSCGNHGRTPDASEVESRLLLHVIETLQQSPGIHRVEAQLLVYESGAVVPAFTEQGFSRHARIFMLLRLSALQARLLRWIRKLKSAAGRSRITSPPPPSSRRLTATT